MAAAAYVHGVPEPAGGPNTGAQAQRQPADASAERIGLSAGVAIMWKSEMTVSRVPDEWYAGKLAGDEGRARVVAVILRCRKVSVLVIEAYLYSGEGLGQPNLDLLQAIVGMVRCSGLPAIICGDFQNTRVELGEVQSLNTANLHFVSNDTVPTCFGTTPRPIDHCCVSAELRPAVADAVVRGSVRRSHSAVYINLLLRPRSLQGLQQVQVQPWPELMPDADGRLECNKAVWDKVLKEEASSQRLEVNPQGFLVGASLQQHLEVVSGAAEAYAFEIQRTAKKGRTKRGAPPKFAMKPLIWKRHWTARSSSPEAILWNRCTAHLQAVRWAVTTRVRPLPVELVKFGCILSAQVAVWFVEASPEATLQNLQRVLVGEGTLIENIRVSYAVRVLREVAERQSIRNAEEGFKLQLQADLEKHASFTHKIVSGKSQPVQLPTESLHGAKSTSG